MKHSKRIVKTIVAASLCAWGAAHAIEYYNLTGSAGLDGSASQSSVTFSSGAPNYQATFSVLPQDITTVGTGVIDPFVRIHATNSNENNITANIGANCNNGEDCVEVGYNTDGANKSKLDVQFQEADSQGSNWNHTLKLSDMAKTCVAVNDCYYTFILDINERNNDDRMLSLDQFRIFSSDIANLEGYYFGGAGKSVTSGYNADGTPIVGAYDPASHRLGLTTDGLNFCDVNVPPCTFVDSAGNTVILPVGGVASVYDMDLTAGGDKSIGLDYDLHSGSGKGIDLVVKVDADLFTGEYVYLFSSFGETGIVPTGTMTCTGGATDDPRCKLPAGDFSQSDGFEEWATLRRTPIAPTLALFAVGLVGMAGMRRMRSAAPRFA